VSAEVQSSALTSPDLVEQLANCALARFPRDYDYKTQFLNLQNHLNAYYHSNVTAAATLADGIGYLTDHGVDHIKTVISRASRLLGTGSGSTLTPYEIYILLAAIHVHDLGNFFGRDSHELNVERVMTELGPVLGADDVEKLAIRIVAEAHGGKIGLDKDKIGRLQPIDYVLGESIRPQLLAAVLRLADELADDRTRASRYMIETNVIPKPSLIFHKYAYALHSVVVGADTVSLKFFLSEQDVQNKFSKGGGYAFLIDEIYERTMKMHRERTYCSRFLRPQVNVNRIDVSIEIFTSEFSKKLDTIAYRLEEAGYPDEKSPTIFMLCPSLKGKTGKAVKDLVNKQVKPAKAASSKKRK
jgi:hypothetical protein